MKKLSIIVLATALIFGCQTKKEEIKSEQVDSNNKNETEAVQDSITKQPHPEIAETSQEDNANEVKKNEKADEKWLSEQKLWNLYNASKAKVNEAEKNNNLEDMSKFSHEAAIYAKALNKPDIEAWQYNNAAYYLIKEFKTRTNYQVKMDSLNSLQQKHEIEDYKQELQKNFRQETRLLSKAEGYLKKAKDIDDKLKKSDRTRIISNNISFVDFVMNWLEMEDPELE